MPAQPFGGLQMIFIGDLYQLPPVVTGAEKDLFTLHYETPYFFSARVFAEDALRLEFVELEKIYRQTEADFIGLLNAIRNRSVTPEDLDRLNSRCDPGLRPARGRFLHHPDQHQRPGRRRNREKLDRLDGATFAYEGIIDGEFERSSLPTDERLELKVGAQVMLLNNDAAGPLGQRVDRQDRRRPPGKGRGRHRRSSSRTAASRSPAQRLGAVPLLLRPGQGRDRQRAGRGLHPVSAQAGLGHHHPQEPGQDVPQGRRRHRPGDVRPRPGLRRPQPLHELRRPGPENAHRQVAHPDGLAGLRFLTRFQYDRADERQSYAEKKRIIEEAIGENRDLEILYLKPDDTKSRRRIRPESVEEMMRPDRGDDGKTRPVRRLPIRWKWWIPGLFRPGFLRSGAPERRASSPTSGSKTSSSGPLLQHAKNGGTSKISISPRQRPASASSGRGSTAISPILADRLDRALPPENASAG